MSPPSNQKFVKKIFYRLGVLYFQKPYINLTLFPNAFKLNQEIVT